MTRQLSCFNKPNTMSAVHVASASQIKTWLDCNRKWWFGKGPLKLPELDRGYFTFGTVTHAVNERWLGADDLGNDPDTGKPVDLYPPGWESTLSRDKETMVSVSIAEQDIIKKLVSKAIEDGILVRVPGRRLEQEFWLPLLETEDGGIVWAMGYIDVLLSDCVQDHKTTKNLKYALSPKKLKVDPQMLLYALVVIQRCAETGAPMPEQITLQHNVFCKDPNNVKVRMTQAQVTPDEVFIFLEEARRICTRMVGQLNLTSWAEVPDPEAGANKNACNAYGGCPFLPICSGQESPKIYRERVERIQSTRLESVSGSTDKLKPNTKENTMGNLFEKKLALKRAQNAAVAGASAPPASVTPPQTDGSVLPETPPAAPPAAPPDPAQPGVGGTPETGEMPPWALPSCPACKGRGFNSQGAPCRICDSKQTKAGGIISTYFVIEPIGDGTFVWEVKPEHADKMNAASGTASIPDNPETASSETREDVQTAPAEPEPAASTDPDATEEELVPGKSPVAWDQGGKIVWGLFQKYVKGGIKVVKDGNTRASKVAEGAYRIATEADINPPPPIAATTPPATGEDLSEVVNPTGRKGRPLQGFTLCIGCVPTKVCGGYNIINLDEVMQRYGEMLATQQGVESFYMLDDFKRRNALAHAAPSMVEEFGKSLVLVRGSSQDIRALTDALRPLATNVFEGV